MPNEAKFGLVLGIALTVTLAVLFKAKEPAVAVQSQPTTAVGQGSELQGQTTSNRR